MTVYSDASDFGWGGQFNDLTAQGRFSIEEQQLHINTKEVLAAYYAIRSFRPYFRGNYLLLRSDNTTAIANIRDMGTLLSPIRDDYCRMIWQQMHEQDCWLSVNFIRRVDNTDADATSHLFNDRTKWTLPISVFITFAQCFGCPTIDLFASRLNKKLNRYISWAPDPFCTEVDAFYYTWTHEFPYLYPPFNLLNRCIRKLMDDQVERALVIFPLWPMQHWFTPLMEIVASHVFVLPKEPAIYLPWQDHHQCQRHPNYSSLNLAAALVSTNEDILQEFHHTLQNTSQQEFVIPLLNVTLQSIKNGLSFAVYGKQIPIHLL